MNYPLKRKNCIDNRNKVVKTAKVELRKDHVIVQHQLLSTPSISN